MSSLTIAICTTGRLPELRRCIEALDSQFAPADEILVVWSGFTEVPVIHDWTGALQHVAVPRPGLSIARNAALEAATGNIVAFIDDDAIPEPRWCDALRRAFDDDRTGAACGPVLPLEHSVDVAPSAAVNANFDSVRIVSQNSENWFDLIHFGGFVSGANMAIRREVASAGFRFHPALGRGAAIEGGEEQYAFHEIVERGFLLRYDPAIVVRHAIAQQEGDVAREAVRRQRNGVAYVGFLFLTNATARRALAQRLLRGRLSRGRGFHAIRNARRLRFRARAEGVADLLKWMLARHSPQR